jgi:hypothetical protein
MKRFVTGAALVLAVAVTAGACAKKTPEPPPPAPTAPAEPPSRAVYGLESAPALAPFVDGLSHAFFARTRCSDDQDG